MLRKDNWTPELDQQLAEIVLNHVKTGSTQSKAFEEAADKFNRTPKACGFRWNSQVRREFSKELAEAKEIRSGLSIANKEEYADEIDDNIPFIDKQSEEYKIKADPLFWLDEVKKVIVSLEEENRRLKAEIERLKHTPTSEGTEDLKHLLAILDKARSTGLLQRLNELVG